MCRSAPARKVSLRRVGGKTWEVVSTEVGTACSGEGPGTWQFCFNVTSLEAEGYSTVGLSTKVDLHVRRITRGASAGFSPGTKQSQKSRRSRANVEWARWYFSQIDNPQLVFYSRETRIPNLRADIKFCELFACE
jgi:hypothetical protein